MPARACKHCCSVRTLLARGLCSSCYKRPGVKELYPLLYRRAAPCSGCGTAKAVTRDGLCLRCSGRRTGGTAEYHEPTAEELELLVAEQLPTMPAERAPAGTVGEGPRVAGALRLRYVRRRDRV